MLTIIRERVTAVQLTKLMPVQYSLGAWQVRVVKGGSL